MIFRPFYRFETGCAAYVFGCGGQGICCVVDPHEADVDTYLTFAADKAMRIAYVFETHVHADHRSGALPSEAFVDQVGASVPPKPASMDEILRFNQGRGP